MTWLIFHLDWWNIWNLYMRSSDLMLICVLAFFSIFLIECLVTFLVVWVTLVERLQTVFGIFCFLTIKLISQFFTSFQIKLYKLYLGRNQKMIFMASWFCEFANWSLKVNTTKQCFVTCQLSTSNSFYIVATILYSLRC